MNPEMKSKALEKLMMVLDEVLGEDVMSRMKSKVDEKTGKVEVEGEEEEGEEVASGGSSILALPEVESEDESESVKGKPAGVGVKATEVEVAAMPKPGLMKKMRGLK